MAEDLRQSSGSTTTGNVMSSTGATTTESSQAACGCPQPGPETIQVEQVLGANMAQQVVESDMFAPARKPDIEQIIDIYVKDLKINSIDVIPNKVIVRGDFGIKVMYVAALPNQPVHAFERAPIRWIQDIDIPGAQRGMDATADVNIEFVDYDYDENNPRQVHFTVVLKVWTRVLTTTQMDVYALTPIDQVGQQPDITSASQPAGEMASENQPAGYGEQYPVITAPSPENVMVTGPGVAPTAGISQQPPGTATVTGNNVNVRTGPGTNFPVVTKVNKGDVVTIIDQAFGWNRVTLSDGTNGWIASWLLSTGETAMPPKG